MRVCSPRRDQDALVRGAGKLVGARLLVCSSQCAYSEGPSRLYQSGGFVLDKFSILKVRENNGNLKFVNQNRGVLLVDLEFQADSGSLHHHACDASPHLPASPLLEDVLRIARGVPREACPRGRTLPYIREWSTPASRPKNVRQARDRAVIVLKHGQRWWEVRAVIGRPVLLQSLPQFVLLARALATVAGH